MKRSRSIPLRERLADVADAFRPRDAGACTVELQQRGLGGSRRDEQVQRGQLPDGVLRTSRQASTLDTPGRDDSDWKVFAAGLLWYNRHPNGIYHPAIDISAAYTKRVSDNFRNARVVYDKFQIIQKLVEACD